MGAHNTASMRFLRTLPLVLKRGSPSADALMTVFPEATAAAMTTVESAARTSSRISSSEKPRAIEKRGRLVAVTSRPSSM